MDLKIFPLLFFTSILVHFSFAQPNQEDQNYKTEAENVKSFEGSIRFVQKTMNDTNYYTYHIKNNKVRLDVHENCSHCKEIENSMLFDLDNNTITALNPSRKLYINVPPKPYMDKQNDKFKIIKSKNCKKIQGYKCFQWRVKNTSEKTEIAYWVADDNFAFFEDFLRLWNRTEKHSRYFLQIPETKGFFPLISVERTTLRDQKMKLEVVDIIKKPLEKKLFEIPEDFQSYDH
jgi:hypothetical protein